MSFLALTLSLVTVLAADPPKVVTLEPANNAKDVDVAKVTKLVVTFDKSMDLSGWSFCGGGPNFPKFKGKPKWDSPKKVVVEVEPLEPDHEYKLGLNCPSAQNFKSSQGVALVPVQWTFKTAPAKGTKAKSADAAKDKPTTGTDSAKDKPTGGADPAKEKPAGGSDVAKGKAAVGAEAVNSASSEDAKSEGPKIVGLEPSHLSASVVAAQTKQLAVTFDRPMSASGWSFCGGGPNFPKIQGKPRWETPQKIVVDVELEPDHEYRLLLNCPAGSNFRSAEGQPLASTPWSFTTLPEKLPDPVKQKEENQQAFDALKKTLAESYAYYDRRVASWDDLYKANEEKILAAETTRAWASAVSAMLAATEDIHLHLRLGDSTFPGGTRAIDPLYREKLIPKYAMVQPVGARSARGRTDDGIGYVMIGGWSNASDVDALEQALPGLRDCKAIVVDVRPNAGGDENLARRIRRVVRRRRARLREGPLPDGAREGRVRPRARSQRHGQRGRGEAPRDAGRGAHEQVRDEQQ
jgi:hypothetical protein